MRSALDKTKISQTTWLSSTGFTGDELIEVSEIREPCWKIQAKYNILI